MASDGTAVAFSRLKVVSIDYSRFRRIERPYPEQPSEMLATLRVLVGEMARDNNRDGKVHKSLTSRLLTLPRVAELIGVEYRTLHTWLKRGLLRPSVQESRGTGFPNLFTIDDLVHAKVIGDLRQSGLPFERLEEAADQLGRDEQALTSGAMVLVNGTVSVVDATEASDVIQRESLTLVYNTEHAAREMRARAGSVA
jgi:DNA-binding transcriptional MerR regulator